MRRTDKPPLCGRCSQPATSGEYTGQHADIEDCLRLMVHRLIELEATQSALLDVMESGACPYCRMPDVPVTRNEIIGNRILKHNLKMSGGGRRQCPASSRSLAAALRMAGKWRLSDEH